VLKLCQQIAKADAACDQSGSGTQRHRTNPGTGHHCIAALQSCQGNGVVTSQTSTGSVAAMRRFQRQADLFPVKIAPLQRIK
jgi:hypothetical protein